MTLRLGKVEREYLKKLLWKHHSTWWPHKKWLNALKQEKELEEEKILCTHKFGKYEGKKTCCTKCGCFGVGMGTNWTLKNTDEDKTLNRGTEVE